MVNLNWKFVARTWTPPITSRNNSATWNISAVEVEPFVVSCRYHLALQRSNCTVRNSVDAYLQSSGREMWLRPENVCMQHGIRRYKRLQLILFFFFFSLFQTVLGHKSLAPLCVQAQTRVIQTMHHSEKKGKSSWASRLTQGSVKQLRARGFPHLRSANFALVQMCVRWFERLLFWADGQSWKHFPGPESVWLFTARR